MNAHVDAADGIDGWTLLVVLVVLATLVLAYAWAKRP